MMMMAVENSTLGWVLPHFHMKWPTYILENFSLQYRNISSYVPQSFSQVLQLHS